MGLLMKTLGFCLIGVVPVGCKGKTKSGGNAFSVDGKSAEDGAGHVQAPVETADARVGRTARGTDARAVVPRPYRPSRDDRATLASDVRRYGKQWVKLGPARTRLKVLLRQAAVLRAKGRLQQVGTLITAKVVPGLSRLTGTLSGFTVRTGTLRKAHLAVVSAYKDMLEAYRLAGRAWQKSGQGVGLALKKLKRARVRLRSARSALAALAAKHGVVIK